METTISKDRIFHVPGKQLNGLCGGAVEFCLGMKLDQPFHLIRGVEPGNFLNR
jgi:hypothetical protein